MSLLEDITEKRKDIHADSYDMSVGEIINMYKDGDLDIHPEFQRFFRWSDSQKTRLIESLLLNIPIPPIFVSQRIDGVWDVVDGLQRLSSIFQFVGIYKDENGSVMQPLVLEGTKLLPNLNGKKFDDSNEDISFSPAEQRYLKRAKISFNILLTESDQSSKYELFQRLNTGGTALSDQEVRNCIMVMTNPELFNKLSSLSNSTDFVNTISISDKQHEERYDMELVTRFVCLRHTDIETVKRVKDFGDFLDDRIVELFNSQEIVWEKEFSIFNRTFHTINDALNDQAFCKYMPEKQRFRGGFNIGAFEIIAIGLGWLDGNVPDNFDLQEKVKALWVKIAHDNLSWNGSNASGRLGKTLELAKSFYEN